MGICDKELEDIMARLTPEDLDTLVQVASRRDFAGMKRILWRYAKVKDCLSIEFLNKFAKSILMRYGEKSDYTIYEFELKPPPGKSLSSGMYPCFSVIEVVYASLYDLDPQSSHELMYKLLEPVLLGPEFSRDERKAIFLPVDSSNWVKVQESLISILGKIDEERRRMFCRGLSKNFHALLYCMDLSLSAVRGSMVASITISGRLVGLCPEMKNVIGESI